MSMLDEKLKNQLKSYLENVTHPVALVASLDDGDKSRELADLLDQIASLSDLISVRHDGASRRPYSSGASNSTIVRSRSSIQ